MRRGDTNFNTICCNPHTKHKGMVTARKDGKQNKLLYEICKGENVMSTVDIVSKIEELEELEKLIEEAKEEAESLRDEIKAEMMRRDTEEMEAGKYIVRWTSVLSNRFDSTAFKKVMPEVYKAYTKQVSSRRFSICG